MTAESRGQSIGEDAQPRQEVVLGWVTVDFEQFSNLLTSRLPLERAYLDNPYFVGLRDRSTDRVYVIPEANYNGGMLGRMQNRELAAGRASV
jgi:hypothetical protein